MTSSTTAMTRSRGRLHRWRDWPPLAIPASSCMSATTTHRETPCPASRPACASSPPGDNWAVWQKDFFGPAAPLLAVAPWVLVRGNHEHCSRGGHGWFHLLDPHPTADRCVNMTPPYALNLPTLHLLLFDSADADDSINLGKVAVYRAQPQELLANVPRMPGS
jgi:hypothetical protein